MMDHSKFNRIKAFLFDVDGVFTNSQVLVQDDGSLLRMMNVRDGQGVKIALEAGYHIAAITKGRSPGVHLRLKDLGLEEVYDGLSEKTLVYAKFMAKHRLSAEEVLYMGDDIPDMDLFSKVGVAACPNDAAHEVLDSADYISPLKGGEGCVREILEKVMRIQGNWPIYIF